MAWLPMYLLEPDIEVLNDWLNKEEEIAFLISNGHKKWIAKKNRDILTDIGTQPIGYGLNFAQPNTAEYNLWHVPSGQLPLLNANQNDPTDGVIDNPWLGWTEITSGANQKVPYFGSGHPGIISLEINLSCDQEIGMSNFGWIGNHYKMIGRAADVSTELFWKKLKRMVKQNSIQISRGNNPNGKKEIYAFNTANKEIQNGRPCALNP